jgi:hypothetical protein
MSPDGRRFALISKYRIIDEGRPGPAFDKVERPVFSRDGSRVAYAATLNERTVVVLDEQPREMGDVVVEQLHFSPDGERLGCLVRRGREIFWRELR